MTHTIASLQDKTPEELTRMLAECLGWKSIMNLRIGFPDCMTGYPPTASGLLHEVPPYATSYDAIMPCVKALTDKQTFAFIEHLRVIRNIQATGDFAFTWLMMTSSEADLTRALILTLTT